MKISNCVQSAVIFLFFYSCSFTPGLENNNSNSGLIGDEGGTYITESGVSITVPRGALNEEIQLSVHSYPDADSMADICGVAAILDGIELGPHGTDFNVPITVRWPLSEERFIPGSSYSLIYFDETENIWIDEGFQGTVNQDGDYFTCSLSHFSPFGTLPGTSGSFGDYFNESTDPNVALGYFIADFLAETNLMAYETTRNGKKYIVSRIDFDLQYSINGTEGQIQASYPPNAPSVPENAEVMSISYSEDKMNSSGVQNVKSLIVTVILKEVPDPYSPVATHYNISYDDSYYNSHKISINIYYNTDMDPTTTAAATSFSPYVSTSHIGPQLVLNYRTEYVLFISESVDLSKEYTLTVKKEAVDVSKNFPLPKDYVVSFVQDDIIANGAGMSTIYFETD